MNVAERFGDNLKRQRKLADLSQEEATVLASLHRTEISEHRIARVDTVVKLAGSLGIPPGELFDGMGWDPGGTQLGRFTEGEG